MYIQTRKVYSCKIICSYKNC